ncbi:MAG: hypothetical protein ACJ740_05790 [Gaiellales bacterium]|jgi:hypothetical protein
MKRLRCALFACALTSAMGVLAGPAITATGPYQPFISTSYWRTPSSAPADAKSGAMISWLSSVLKSDRRFVTIRATNLNSSSAQGTSVYYGASTDPAYKICHNPNYKSYSWTTDFDSVRIPSGARAPTDNDADMMVYNTYQGKLFWFTNMQLISGRWCASQASVYYVGSNGLHGKLPQSDNVKNWGKHGLAPVTQAVRWGEVASGAVPHVMDLYIPSVSCNSDDWFPLYTGTMCTTSASNSIPAGAVLRIKPSIDLSQYPLNPSARIIARGLQQFGAVVGDRSGVGNNATIKLEDTVVEGKGNLWANAGLAFDSLKSIPISAYQIDKLGAGR